MSVRITCINKSNGYHQNPYTAIETLGWIEDGTNTTGRTERLVMFEWVLKGGIAYVLDARNNRANLIAATTALGTKYVKTVADETKSDNLLQLPECK